MVCAHCSASACLPKFVYQSLSTKAVPLTRTTSSSYITAPHNVPCIMRRTVSPGTQPASMPTPGAVRRACAALTSWALPATYPPPVTMVPPGFLIRLPMHKSAPTCAKEVITIIITIIMIIIILMMMMLMVTRMMITIMMMIMLKITITMTTRSSKCYMCVAQVLSCHAGLFWAVHRSDAHHSVLQYTVADCCPGGYSCCEMRLLKRHVYV